jgi:hypothetical protein
MLHGVKAFRVCGMAAQQMLRRVSFTLNHAE